MLICDKEYRPNDPVDGAIEIRELPGGRCLTLLHRGPHERISSACARLFSRIAELGLRAETASNRLRYRQFVKDHPQVLDTKIERPIFVLGFPRTGTTILQNLLCLDPNRRGLEFWELTVSPGVETLAGVARAVSPVA